MATENQLEKKVVIAGVGGGAGKIIRCIAELRSCRPGAAILNLDTDKNDLIAHEHIKSILLNNDWTHQDGCGGNPLLGENATSANIDVIREAIDGADILIVVGCLGRGTASGAVQALSRLLKDDGAKTFFIVTSPFSFEGKTAKKINRDTLARLRKTADVVIAIPNDLVFDHCPPDRNAGETFEQANELLAETIVGIGDMFRHRGIIPFDFSSLKSVLKNKDAYCTFGVGRSSGERRTETVIENLFQSPMLGGREFVAESNVIVAVLTGGNDLRIGEMNECLDSLSSQVGSVSKLIIGANVVPDKNNSGEIQLSMLAIRYSKTRVKGQSSIVDHVRLTPVPGIRGSAVPKSTRLSKQMDLPLFEEGLTLGIFGEVTATIYQDQNLDIPTFQRLGVALDDDTPIG